MNFPPNGGPVCRILKLEANNTQQDQLFEITEDGCPVLEPHCGGY